MIRTEQAPSYAVIFPGQGSQHAGMADVWADHPLGREVFEETAELTGFDIIAGCHDDKLLAMTDFVQPALLACEIAAFRVLDAAGFEFRATAGHSLGEFSALVAAGSLSLGETLRIVKLRGQAMQAATQKQPGVMSAILGANIERVRSICDSAVQDDVLVMANENSPVQTVISGTVAAVERAEALAKAQKVRAIRLPVAGAFHSPLMQSAVEPIREALSDIVIEIPRFPIAENVSGTLISNPVELRALLERHVVSPVKWEASIRALGAVGINRFIEAGPGNVLSKLNKRILPEIPTIALVGPADVTNFQTCF